MKLNRICVCNGYKLLPAINMRIPPHKSLEGDPKFNRTMKKLITQKDTANTVSICISVNEAERNEGKTP